jgi:hypothetical protein
MEIKSDFNERSTQHKAIYEGENNDVFPLQVAPTGYSVIGGSLT